MSPVNNFAMLALAASAMAIPQHGYQHKRYHESASGSASAVSRYSHSGSRHPHSYSGSVRPSKSGHKSSGSAKATAPAGYTSISRASAPGTISAADVAPSATSTCTDDVTVTSIENVTVYVTESAGAPASSSESAATEVTTSTASSEEVASSSSSSEASLAATGARYGGWGSHSGWQHESASTEAAAPTTSSTVAPTYQATTFSSQVVPATTAPTSTYVPSTTVWSATVPAITVPSVAVPSVVSSIVSSVVSSVVSVATSAAAAATPSGYGGSTSSNTGKRGLAFNDVSLTQCFAGSSEISWGYNWGSEVYGGSLPAGVKFIPTLWSDASNFTETWSANAQAAIDNKAQALFSFNEPDHPKQANMEPAAAATAYAKYMNPFYNQGAKLCAPAVTNGGGSMGLTWLKSFLSACGTSCDIDCINIHWYDSASNVAYFKQHIQDTIAIAGGKPIYVSEFGATSGTDAEIAAFLDEVMPYMDGMSQIAGYAYFMVEQGVLVNNNEPSTYGKTYMAAN